MDIQEAISKISGSGIEDAGAIVSAIQAVVGEASTQKTRADDLEQQRQSLADNNQRLMDQRVRFKNQAESLQQTVDSLMETAAIEGETFEEKQQALKDAIANAKTLTEERDTANSELTKLRSELALTKAAGKLGIEAEIIARAVDVDPAALVVDESGVKVKDGDNELSWEDFIDQKQPPSVKKILELAAQADSGSDESSGEGGDGDDSSNSGKDESGGEGGDRGGPKAPPDNSGKKTPSTRDILARQGFRMAQPAKTQ